MFRNIGLGSVDVKKILIGFLVAEGGAVLATALLWLQSGRFNFNELVLLEEGAVLSAFVNFARKLFDGIKE